MLFLRRIRAGADWREASVSVFPGGSYGNGAAMRAAPLGLFFRTRPHELVRAAQIAAAITHAHPEGVDGGVLLAKAAALVVQDAFDWEALRDVCREPVFRERLLSAEALGGVPVADVRRRLGHDVRAARSAPTAIHLYARFADRPFEELMAFVVKLGGDTDTIGAMAGALWGAARGAEALPHDLLEALEERERLDAAARALFAHGG